MPETDEKLPARERVAIWFLLLIVRILIRRLPEDTVEIWKRIDHELYCKL